MTDPVDIKPIEEIIPSLSFIECSVEACGSRITCNPPPADTDRDYLVYAPHQAAVCRVMEELHRFGFIWEGSPKHYQDAAANGFMSWRRKADNINLIVTANLDFACRHRTATVLCKRLNLMNKEDRIALFQAVLYGVQWDGNAVKITNPADDFEEVKF